MAEKYLTLNQFEDLIRATLCSILGWEVSTSNMRISWPTDGMPAWQITEDVIFLKCFEIDNSYNREREDTDTAELSPEIIDREISYTRVMQTGIILYGPNSFDLAQQIRDGIFYEGPRIALAQSNVYLVHDIVSPRRLPEYFEGRWWERVDMDLRFYELIVKSVSIPIITSIPIGIYEGEEGKKITDINVEE